MIFSHNGINDLSGYKGNFGCGGTCTDEKRERLSL